MTSKHPRYRNEHIDSEHCLYNDGYNQIILPNQTH